MLILSVEHAHPQNSNDSTKMMAKLLRISTFLILSGTGITHFTGENPYLALYPFASLVPIIFGVLFLLSASLLLSPVYGNRRLLDVIIPTSAILLLHLSFSAFVHDHYAPEQLLEQGIKIGVPVSYWLYFTQRISTEKIILFLKFCVLFCFVGHGMFALGIHFVPSAFTEMTTTILGVDLPQAKHILFVIGILDFIAAISIFFSNSFVFYGYLILWGFLTSLARVVYGTMINEGDLTELTHYFFNTIYRLPHGLIPLLIYLYYHNRSKQFSAS